MPSGGTVVRRLGGNAGKIVDPDTVEARPQSQLVERIFASEVSASRDLLTPRTSQNSFTAAG